MKQEETRRQAGRAPLAAAMRDYAADGALAFHTPGHKQGLGAHPLLRQLVTAAGLREEVSLMEELDDLHEPTGCIREAQALAARLYGADAAYFMVNGTTGAIHAMLLGTLAPGDEVLVPRNAHRSMIGGIILAGARPVFLQPEVDAALGIAMGLSVRTVRRALLEHPQARAIALVYPTYYGVTSNLAAIAALAHERGLLVLVDEAHGAHLRFSAALPPQALDEGADASAQSTHKLLGAMTQASMLLVRHGRVDGERIRAAASLLQSTSPNYLLLASLDIARLQMEESGEALVGRAVRLAEGLRQRINAIEGLYAFGAERLSAAEDSGACGLDATKVTVSVRGLGLTGAAAEHILRHRYKIQCELADAGNVLFILSFADTEREAERLLAALRSLAAHHRQGRELPLPARLPAVPRQALTPREAFFAPAEAVPFDAAAGRTAAEQVMFYPPGIPVLCPGDVIDDEALAYIRAMQAAHLKVVGPKDAALRQLQVTRR